MTIEVDGCWPLAAAVAAPDQAEGVDVVFGSVPDLERGADHLRSTTGADRNVVVVLGFGRMAPEPRYALLLRVISKPLIGLQLAQLSTVARWARERFDGPTTVRAHGPVAAIIALLARALTPDLFTALETTSLPYTLDDLIESQLPADEPQYPLFCFALRQTLDVSDLLSLTAPLTIQDRFRGHVR